MRHRTALPRGLPFFFRADDRAALIHGGERIFQRERVPLRHRGGDAFRVVLRIQQIERAAFQMRKPTMQMDVTAIHAAIDADRRVVVCRARHRPAVQAQ